MRSVNTGDKAKGVPSSLGILNFLSNPAEAAMKSAVLPLAPAQGAKTTAASS